jgi:hypothetical protein
MSDSDLPFWPAALRLDQAAAYSGLSVQIFKEVCPVKPVSFTASTRGDRYLRSTLDNWLQSLNPNAASIMAARRFGEKING